LQERANTRFNRKAVIVTGELSGEIHAAHLVQAINQRLPLEFSGIGSKRLASAGVRIIQDYEQISLVGLSEILSKIGHIRRVYRLIKAHLAADSPSLLILIDFPGFNLRLATIAHRLGIPTIYFIPPQVWAWNKGRIKQIKKYVDLVICILPFEEQLYRECGIPVAYVGHPFARTVKPLRSRGELLSEIGLNRENAKILSILPGSRENEIKTHLPLLLRVVDLIKREIPNLVVLMPLSDNTKDSLVDRFLHPDTPVVRLRGRTYDALAASDAAVIVSGSATLEAALLGAPSIVLYKISYFSYLAAKLLVKVDYISLPNLVANKEIFPEHIQRVNPERIAEEVVSMVKNGTGLVREELKKVSESLGDQDSYSLAAEEIVRFVENKYGTLS
jgi:lipid-A-disaccharide synthase